MKATSIAIALSLAVTDGLLIAAAAKPSLVGRAPVGAVRMTTMKAAAAKVAAMRAVNDVDEPERSERAALNIAQTTYHSTMKSPKDAYIAFAEKGASNAKMDKRKSKLTRTQPWSTACPL